MSKTSLTVGKKMAKNGSAKKSLASGYDSYSQLITKLEIPKIAIWSAGKNLINSERKKEERGSESFYWEFSERKKPDISLLLVTIFGGQCCYTRILLIGSCRNSAVHFLTVIKYPNCFLPDPKLDDPYCISGQML